MRKIFVLAAVLGLSLGMIRCSSDKQVVRPDLPVDPQPVPEMVTARLVASMSDAGKTRVAVSPQGQLEWTPDDRLQVFVSESGSPATEKRVFVTSEQDAAAGRFTDERNLQLDKAKTYDWYVALPDRGQALNPDGSGVFVIGDQVQNGADNVEHIGRTIVGTAVAKGISGAVPPSLTMDHHTALMVFQIKNLEESLTVKGIRIETDGNTPMGGGLQVAYEGADRVTDGVKSLSLDLGSAVLGQDEMANTFMSVIPFALDGGNRFTITVLTDKGNLSQTMTLKQGQHIGFERGRMYTTLVKIKGKKITSVVIDWEQAGEINGDLQPDIPETPGCTGSFEQLLWEESEVEW